MRLIINLCCFSLPPSLQVLGKGVGMEGEGGMEGRGVAEREERPPISPSPSSKHWKKQAPAPSRTARQPSGGACRSQAVWAQAGGLVGAAQGSSAAASCLLIFLLRGHGGWATGAEGVSLLPHAPTSIMGLHFPHWGSQKGRWWQRRLPIKKCSFYWCFSPSKNSANNVMSTSVKKWSSMPVRYFPVQSQSGGSAQTSMWKRFWKCHSRLHIRNAYEPVLGIWVPLLWKKERGKSWVELRSGLPEEGNQSLGLVWGARIRREIS